MKISHRKLEQIRRNPSSIKQVLNDNSGRNSMSRSLEFAIRKYHQTNGNKEYAYQQLQSAFNSFADNKRNRQIQQILFDKFRSYIDEYETLRLEFINDSLRISIDIHHGNVINGEIFRIDKQLDGENILITLLIKEPNDNWKTELRFPLLQIHFSDKYSIPSNNIKIGIYDLENEIHKFTTFDEISLRKAEEEVRLLSNQLNRFII